MGSSEMASRRDLELLHHCEGLTKQFGVSLFAAIKEWASARKVAGEISIPDAVRFYIASRRGLLAVKSIKEVAHDIVESRRVSGVTDHCVYNCKDYTKQINLVIFQCVHSLVLLTESFRTRWRF